MKSSIHSIPQPARPADEAVSGAVTTGKALHPPRRVRGWISIEMGISIAVVATMLLFLGPKIAELFTGARTQQAFTEMNDLILAAERYRSVNGGYGSPRISIFSLGRNGYGFTSQLAANGGTVGAAGDAGENVYGLDMQVRQASGGADATITYDFKDSEPCNQIRSRIENYPQVKGTPACAAASGNQRLTVTIE